MFDQPIRNLGKGKRLSPNPNLNITNNDKDKIIPVADDLNILGCIKQDKAADANAVGKRKPNVFNEKAYKINTIKAVNNFIKVLIPGHDGSLSGFIIIVKEQIKAAPETIKGKFFGPNGSAKKGDSNWVALTKNVSANIVSIEPNIRSDTISLHQVLWIKLGLLP